MKIFGWFIALASVMSVNSTLGFALTLDPETNQSSGSAIFTGTPTSSNDTRQAIAPSSNSATKSSTGTGDSSKATTAGSSSGKTTSDSQSNSQGNNESSGNNSVISEFFITQSTIKPQSALSNTLLLGDPTGAVQTHSTSGSIPLNQPFFTPIPSSIGPSNGRTCVNCHQPSDAMGLSADNAILRFEKAKDSEPPFSDDSLFRVVDAANCPNASPTNTSSKTFSLLLNHGLIRVGRDAPNNADFKINLKIDPNGCYQASDDIKFISTYRRPLPSTNLNQLSALMWDGRFSGLPDQAISAIQKHAELTVDPNTFSEVTMAIVAQESTFLSAQTYDNKAGRLDYSPALGGAGNLNTLGLGRNDPTNSNFKRSVFNLYSGWLQSTNPSQSAIARGEVVFNSKTFTIAGIPGIEIKSPGTCSVCHNNPNFGNDTTKSFINTGVADVESPLSPASYLPTFQLCSKTSPSDCLNTSDPGYAMTTGSFSDIGKFKVPILRGLAARAPYFHNGSAQSLDDVLSFYVSKFAIKFEGTERSDLIAFLNAL